jgi:hypothetical protein
MDRWEALNGRVRYGCQKSGKGCLYLLKEILDTHYPQCLGMYFVLDYRSHSAFMLGLDSFLIEKSGSSCPFSAIYVQYDR